MSITKEIFRKNCLKKIKKNIPNKLYLDKKLNYFLYKEIKKNKNKKKILFYIPLKFEADILETLKKLRKKHLIFVPFMEGKSFKMVSYRLPLKKKQFNIYEAGNSYKKIKNIDIAVVPVIGIDKNFKRIGFGKGMYDRFFEKLEKKPYTIFVQTKLCYTKKEVCDDFDIDCDVIITSKGRLEKRR